MWNNYSLLWVLVTCLNKCILFFMVVWRHWMYHPTSQSVCACLCARVFLTAVQTNCCLTSLLIKRRADSPPVWGRQRKKEIRNQLVLDLARPQSNLETSWQPLGNLRSLRKNMYFTSGCWRMLAFSMWKQWQRKWCTKNHLVIACVASRLLHGIHRL